MNVDEYATYVRTQARTPHNITLDAHQLRQTLGAQSTNGDATELASAPQVTLAVGFTIARYAWHLYLDGAELVCLIYNEGGARRSEILTSHRGPTLPAHAIPMGVAYPELTQRCFAETMASHGLALDFVDFNAARQHKTVGTTVYAKTTQDFGQEFVQDFDQG